jgi:hypothetical protein
MRYPNLYLQIARVMTLAIAISSAGCATQSVNQYVRPFDAGKYKTVRIQPCTNRTGTDSSRNIADEATQSLNKKIADSGLFAIKTDGELMLSCDVESFVEGNALKRWFLPGWGATKAKISVMVWEAASQTVLTVLTSIATVESGGLYTVGADQYIIDVAINDIVSQLTNASAQKTELP